MRRVFPFVCFLPNRDRTRPSRIFQHRDVSAAFELFAALSRASFGFGSLLLNNPPRRAQQNEELLRVQHGAVAGDLIVTTTRWPIHLLWEKEEQKQVRRGYTDLENVIAAAWSRYFRLLTRSYAVLAARLEPGLPAHRADRKHATFYNRMGAAYRLLGRKRYQGARRTAVFLLHEPELWAGGPGYLGVFGMDGSITLLWAHLLRVARPDLLETPGFLMAELEMQEIPERATNLDFALDWKLEILLQHRLQDRPEIDS